MTSADTPSGGTPCCIRLLMDVLFYDYLLGDLWQGMLRLRDLMALLPMPDHMVRAEHPICVVSGCVQYHNHACASTR